MLEKIKEDIDKDLPKIGRLMDEAGDDIVKKMDRTIYFYGHSVNSKYPYLSNFYPSDFIDDNISYYCSEQYLMAQKAFLMNDLDIYEKIMGKLDYEELPIGIDNNVLLLKISLFLYNNSYISQDINLL